MGDALLDLLGGELGDAGVDVGDVAAERLGDADGDAG